MKKLLLAVMILGLIASFVIAQEAAKIIPPDAETVAPEVVAQPAAMTITGELIDSMCAGSQKPEALADFVKGHTKACATMPACAASGYSIFADGKLTKFDAASNAKIVEFLSNPDSKLQVVVEANKVNEELSLVSIKNQ